MEPSLARFFFYWKISVKSMIQKVSVTLCKKYREKGNMGVLW
jgi:hypothetical protein